MGNVTIDEVTEDSISYYLELAESAKDVFAVQRRGIRKNAAGVAWTQANPAEDFDSTKNYFFYMWRREPLVRNALRPAMYYLTVEITDLEIIMSISNARDGTEIWSARADQSVLSPSQLVGRNPLIGYRIHRAKAKPQLHPYSIIFPNESGQTAAIMCHEDATPA